MHASMFYTKRTSYLHHKRKGKARKQKEKISKEQKKQQKKET